MIIAAIIKHYLLVININNFITKVEIDSKKLITIIVYNLFITYTYLLFTST